MRKKKYAKIKYSINDSNSKIRKYLTEETKEKDNNKISKFKQDKLKKLRRFYEE